MDFLNKIVERWKDFHNVFDKEWMPVVPMYLAITAVVFMLVFIYYKCKKR